MADDTSTLSRRHFLRASAVGATAVGVGALTAAEPQHVSAASVRGRRPNVLYVFSDQHRASAMGCYGDPNVRTPVFDAFAKQGAQFNAGMSSTPVCCPHRACLLTGQYSHHNGMVSNSVEWAPNQPCVADLFGAAGYRTGYIGKWHLNSPKAEGAKGGYVAKERRFGFDWWRMSSAGHKYYDYNYFVDDAREPTKTDVYQPTMMANQAIEFIGEKSKGEAPWLLYLSWGPPHTPYEAPPEYRAHYENITLEPNVPAGKPREHAMKNLPDYYGLVESLDTEFGRILKALDAADVAEDTIVIYSSDHGDMLGSHGYPKKRWPHDNSSRVPFLIRYPRAIDAGQIIDDPINTPDVYPTLAGFAGLQIPDGIDGVDYSDFLSGIEPKPPRDYAYLQMIYGYVPWSGWRALRTRDYSYARTEKGPWLLFDVKADPHQLNNLVDDPKATGLVARMDKRLLEVMKESGDAWDIMATKGFSAPSSLVRRRQNSP